MIKFTRRGKLPKRLGIIAMYAVYTELGIISCQYSVTYHVNGVRRIALCGLPDPEPVVGVQGIFAMS